MRSVSVEDGQDFHDLTADLVATSRISNMENKIGAIVFFNQASQQMLGIMEGPPSVVRKELGAMRITQGDNSFEVLLESELKTPSIPTHGLTKGSGKDFISMSGLFTVSLALSRLSDMICIYSTPCGSACAH